MLTVCIPFVKDPINFAVLLSTIQPQLHPDDDLYIIDTSPDKFALKAVAIYGTTRCYIFVEPAPFEKSLEYSIQSMVENNQQALIMLSEDAFISSTFIANMKKVIDSPYDIVSPKVFQNPYQKMDNNFKFFNSTKPDLTMSDNFSPYCFMITNKTKEKPKGYGLLNNEYVLILKNP